MVKRSEQSYKNQKVAHDAVHVHGGHSIFGKWSNYLPEFIYGWIDGIVTTFAVVAWATGANLDISVVLILWFANLFADGFSMSVWSYLSTKSTIDKYYKNKKEEAREIDQFPAVEEQEVRQIYQAKGFEGELLEQVVAVITSDKERRVAVMMSEELWMSEPDESPIINGLITFISFLIVGLIPLLAYIFYYFDWIEEGGLFVSAITMSAVGFVLIGLLDSYISQMPWRKKVFETGSLGLLAAFVAYYVGDVLEKIIVG